jgi:hypothetical protein
MSGQNQAAKELWAQIFSRAAALPNAAMHDPESQSDEDREKSMAEALLEAGARRKSKSALRLTANWRSSPT